jgi:NodT family efflux transporter outer membrane factor (OMF) lipoprotein
MRILQRGILAGVLLAAVGCGSPPQRVEPELELDVPGAWSARPVAAAFGDSTSWWGQFGDSVLDSLMTRAITHNYDLRAAVTRIDAALAQARISGADALPSVNASFTGTRDQRVFIGTPIPNSTSTTLGVALNTTWELDLWGRVRKARSAALADAQAVWADANAAALSLAGQTAKTYFAAVELRLQIALTEATVSSFRTSANFVRDRFERGVRPSLDLRLALTSLADAEALLEFRRAQYDRTLRQLQVLLGKYPDAAIGVTDSLPEIPAPVPAGLPSEILMRRPDLVAAERRLAAAGARISEARRAFLPRIALTGSVGRTSGELSDLLDDNFSVWNIVGNLVQPIFQQGRLRAGLQLAHADAELLLADYAQSILRAYSDVESALATEGYLADQERAQAEAARQAIAAQALAEDRYRQGLADYITVLAAQQTALDAQIRLLAVQRLRLDARIDLHLALGGGFELQVDEEGTIGIDAKSDDPLAGATPTEGDQP